ncbi:MAG TPA: C-type lectin domain-containing protein, partial [Polyangiaceae bacterium]|nr:C-type lectin domain-containing protein [Polyangiaceae bacterium]
NGGSGPIEPSAVRIFGTSTTQTAGGSAFPYFDVCPEDEVLIGINGWTQPDASPSWLMRGQAVCGKIVLTQGGSPGGGGAGGAAGAAGAPEIGDDSLSIRIEPGALLYERGNGLIDDVQGPAMCNPNEVVVGFDGRQGAFMDRIRVYCAPLLLTGGPGTYAIEIGEFPTPRGSVGISTGGGAFAQFPCPAGQIARGAQIQAGSYLDAFGLICGKPELVYPVGAACTDDAECDTASCASERCAAVTCGELTGAGGDGGAGGASPGISAICSCALFGTRQYLFCDGSPTWPEARDACADRGMQLVRPNDGGENGWLRSTALQRAIGSFWIGATDAVTEGDWLWTDGTLFWQGPWDTGAAVGGLYTAWSGAQPDNAAMLEHCGEMYPDSRWNDNECTNPKDFVCEPL